MSRADRARWDSKRRGRRGRRGAPATAPCETLVRLAERLPACGRALDVACGDGTNAVWLAERGLRVDAVDGSRVALANLDARLSRRGLSDRVTPILADLDQPPFCRGIGAYDLVVCISFLDRALIAELPAWLAPGGWILFETFHEGYRDVQPAFRAEWLLARGEARLLFPTLERVDDGEDATRAFVLARRRGSPA